MELNLKQVITDLENRPVIFGDEKSQRDMKLGDAIIYALTAQIKNDDPTPDEKVQRFNLAVRISGKDSVEVSAEEVGTIKKLVGTAWSTIIVGRVFEMLEGLKMPIN